MHGQSATASSAAISIADAIRAGLTTICRNDVMERYSRMFNGCEHENSSTSCETDQCWTS